MSAVNEDKTVPPAQSALAAWVRPANEGDVEALVALRLALFRDMGYQDPALLEELRQACRRYIATALPTGEFRAWIAEAGHEVVACGGLVIHSIPPTAYNLAGREGYIMNMYTRPEWRRQGLARAILRAILAHLSSEGVPVATLHATPEGNRLYVEEGFEEGNEMHRGLGSGRGHEG